MKNVNGKKLLYIIGFLFFFYLFIFSISVIKYSFTEIGSSILKITHNDISEFNAFGLGWLLAIIMQSSGAATSALISLGYAGVIGPVVLIFMVFGTRIGTTITSLFFSLLVSAKRRDFRHGFEIGLANLVYAFPIAVFMFIIEYFFSFFSTAGNQITSLGFSFNLGFIESITYPLIILINAVAPKYFLAFFGTIILILSLRTMPYFLLHLWGEGYFKRKINKYMEKKSRSFFIGFLIALVLTSTSITLTLLIPFVVSRMLNLKKIIPYIIGTNLGGVIDVIFGGLVVGQTSIPAVFAYVSFSVIGLFWLFNTDLMFKITKFISKRTFHISRTRAILLVLIFVLVAVGMSFV